MNSLVNISSIISLRSTGC
uniref:Uncharacterized protein n=1 Tax=Rhizophora mucronata TaxID=61149 RepID=A0A2P2PGE6_RHIMU